MAKHDMQEDDYELNIFAIRAEGIVRELTNVACTASRRGYGTTQLIFSDWSFVSLTDSCLPARNAQLHIAVRSNGGDDGK